jgi:hypothetical protein
MMIDTMCCYTEKETKLVKIHTHLSDEKANKKKSVPLKKQKSESVHPRKYQAKKSEKENHLYKTTKKNMKD